MTGVVEGLPLCASGVLLEQRAATADSVPPPPSPAGKKGHVQLSGVCDWVIDHSQPAAIWIITRLAWYR